MQLEYWLVTGGLIITALAVGLAVQLVRHKLLKDLFNTTLAETSKVTVELAAEQAKYRKLLSQKKSSETRLGQISENLVPFLDGCPYNPKDMHFMANPIDYLIFDLEEPKIVFLEVKSGNSRPSKRQKIIKNIIQAGHVYYEELRINEKGVKTKEAKNVK